MQNKKHIKYIVFDFDGVLLDSNEIRFQGFADLFHNFPKHEVEELLAYVRKNGGLSRYKKIEYFYKNIVGRQITSQRINQLADTFSGLVKQKIIECEPVDGAMEFLAAHHMRYEFAIVSGSDQEELRAICQARGIADFFAEILGSPTEKEENLKKLLHMRSWSTENCVYIGDSVNDLIAAQANKISFIGRNSNLTNWQQKKVHFIENLYQLHKCLIDLTN